MREENDIDNIKSIENQKNYRKDAVRACNIFLDHCGVVAGDPFIRGVEQNYRVQDGQYYVLTLHSVTWFDAETRKPLSVYTGGVNASACSGAVRAPVTGVASMVEIQKSLGMSTDPDIAQSLIVDAKEYVVRLGKRGTCSSRFRV